MIITKKKKEKHITNTHGYFDATLRAVTASNVPVLKNSVETPR